MKTFADVKRRLVVGATLVMERNDWQVTATPQNVANPLIGIKRSIVQRGANHIQFSPHKEGSSGSYLHFPKASDVIVTGADTFAVMLDPTRDTSKLMAYRFI